MNEKQIAELRAEVEDMRTELQGLVGQHVPMMYRPFARGLVTRLLNHQLKIINALETKQ